MNKVLLLGRLGGDPELRYTQGGQACLKISMATAHRYKAKDGWKEQTEWHKVTVWGERGASLHKILGKGSQIFVEGRISTRTYEKDGQKRFFTEIHADNIVLCDRKGDRVERQEAAPEPDGLTEQQTELDSGGTGEEDIPF